MQIKVHTDNHITGDERLDEYTDALIRGAVERFDSVTRVDAHLADENSSGKGAGDDKRCTLEAHVAGRPPVAVTHRAATVREALTGAASRLEKVLSDIDDKRRDKHPG